VSRGAAVVVLLLVVAFVWFLMWRAWHRRAARQSDIPAPALPPEDLVDAVPRAVEHGLYVGTTRAGDWLDRVARHGLGHRSAAQCRVYDSGVLLARQGATDVWIPARDVEAARVDTAAAGKVTADGGIVVISWRLGERPVETGFRCQSSGAVGPLLMSLDDMRSQAAS
jgi:hypothetical protein